MIFLLIAFLVFILLIASLLLAAKIGQRGMNQMLRNEVQLMFKHIESLPTELITEADLAKLPEAVQRWLRRAGVVGKPRVNCVRLKQRGRFRQKPGQAWMPFEAEEYFSSDPPAFVWSVSMRAAPLFSVKGRDLYSEGRGNMLIRPLGLFTAADARGPEIDQGALTRFLNEIMWFPDAALNDYVVWEAIDDDAARATMTYGGVSASAVFHFSASGDLVTMVAERYRSLGDSFSLDTWSTPISAYGEFQGRRLPVQGEGVWHLADGDFAYIRIELLEIEYDVAEVYSV